MSFTFDAPFKDPDSTLDYSMDWADWLKDGESLSAQAVTVSPAGLTITNVGRTGSVVNWRAAGGEVGRTYFVTVRVTTSTGQIDDRTVRIRLRQL